MPMCGRYASTHSPDELTLAFDADDCTEDAAPPPDYNVAPTKSVYAVRAARRDRAGDSADAGASSDGAGARPAGAGARPAGAPGSTGRRLDVLSWGLIPSWARDRRIASRLLNARAETLTTTPAFRSAFARRRCLIPADGWYEWTPHEDRPGKQPYFLTPADGSLLAFAGLWEIWGAGDERVLSCTVVTTAAHGALADVHDRMPLVLPPDRWAAWLGEPSDVPAERLLDPTSASVVAALEIRPVGPRVGNVANNGRDLVTAQYGSGDAAPMPTLF
jgi:putative SOS response-associated peptidase YedK